jgi:hypothetical protein
MDEPFSSEKKNKKAEPEIGAYRENASRVSRSLCARRLTFNVR